MSHTPTLTAIHVEEYRITLGLGHYHVVGTATHEIGYFSRRDDAAHIVHCVNVHDQLVAALTVLLQNCELGEYECQKQGKPRMIEAREKARQALAAAEKGA